MSDALLPPDLCKLCSLCLEHCSPVGNSYSFLRFFPYTLVLWETISVNSIEGLDALAMSPHPILALSTSPFMIQLCAIHPHLLHGFAFHGLSYPRLTAV